MKIVISALMATVLFLSGCQTAQQISEGETSPDAITDAVIKDVNAGCDLRKAAQAPSFDVSQAIDTICNIVDVVSAPTFDDPQIDVACFRTREYDATLEWKQVCGQRDVGKS